MAMSMVPSSAVGTGWLVQSVSPSSADRQLGASGVTAEPDHEPERLSADSAVEPAACEGAPTASARAAAPHTARYLSERRKVDLPSSWTPRRAPGMTRH